MNFSPKGIFPLVITLLRRSWDGMSSLAVEEVVSREARPWSDFVHRVYADLRLSRGWGEPTAVAIPALQLTALCGGVPGEAVQLVVPFSTQRTLCAEELDAVLAEAAAVGALTAILAMQDDTSVLVYLRLSASSMEP